MEGTLLKWTNYLLGWKERFFVLRSSVLYYYYEKNAQAKGRIFLGLTVIVSEENALVIELSTGSAVLYIKAKDKEEKGKWLQALKIAKLEGENMLKAVNNANQTLLSSHNVSQAAIKRLMELQQSMKMIIEQSLELGFNKDLTDIMTQYDKELLCLQSEENVSPSAIRENENEIIQPSVKVKALAGPRQFLHNHRYEDEHLDSYRTKEDEVFFYVDDEDVSTAFPNSNKTSPTLITSIKKKESKKVYYDPLYNYQRRTGLPASRRQFKINLWSFFKGAVGKDVNRFCVPVFFNEPLSMLQKLAENFQYASLLNEAAVEPNKYMRLALCATFCIAGFAMNVNRATKFFNPLLFETYEYIDNELDYRYFGEQVSHHPAISACFVEGKGWTYYTNNNAICRFLITGLLEVNNIGRCYTNFSNFNDNIVFTKPLCVVRNLIFGKLTLDMVGKYYAKNNWGDICEIDIVPSTSGVQGNLSGTVKDIYGNLVMRIEGNWLESIRAVDLINNTSKELWRIIPSAGYENYYLQPYSFDLNHMTGELRNALPPTDSRFRPDQQMVERQEMDEAGDEKHRLEEKQRKTRAENQKKGVVVKPMYFDETYDDLTGELIYKYKGNYFTDRQNRNFSLFPDIF